LILILLIIQLVIGFLDFFSSNFIRNLFFDAPEMLNRFTGFNHEPRALGRNSLYAYFLLTYLYSSSNKKDNYANLGRLIAAISILLSISLSTYIAFAFVISLTSFRSVKNTISAVIGLSISVYFILQIPAVQDLASEKFLRVIVEGDNGGRKFSGPEIFSHLEAPNSAYLYFIWDNPRHIFLGTGPNLINIAYQDYATIDWMQETDDQYYVTITPTIGILRLFARSGLFGFFILFIFIYLIKKRSRKLNINNKLKKSRMLLLNQIFILSMIIYSQWFYFIIGYILFENYYDSNSKNLK
jgi:hypothetical protein